MFATIRLQLNDMEPTDIDRKVGEIPIMLRSVVCHLHGMTSEQLIKHGEEPWEFGGYFISVRFAPCWEKKLSRAVPKKKGDGIHYSNRPNTGTNQAKVYIQIFFIFPL
jgi:hypothetical protein